MKIFDLLQLLRAFEISLCRNLSLQIAIIKVHNRQ